MLPTDAQGRATQIRLFSLASPHMRTFHLTWFAFFLAFFGWFGIAPLMAVVRDDLSLTKVQIGNTIIASVAITALARVLIGIAADRWGPRRTYAALLVLGSIPVAAIGLANDYQTFLLMRLAIGAIGAAFVLTQMHTSLMFAPNVVGTANATTAGWGNLGAGVTQIVMPLVFTAILSLGIEAHYGWRLAMVVPGLALFVAGIAYYALTEDTPRGDFVRVGRIGGGAARGAWRTLIRDPRVWGLFLAYAACFGVELTINNVAALYFQDRFALSLAQAGLVAGLFGLMNIFARTLGGILSDRLAYRGGLPARVKFLFAMLLVEGLLLMLFARMGWLPAAIGTLILFSVAVQMAEGATFSLVPFVHPSAVGAVAGLVGAGGNVGAIVAGFLFRIPELAWGQALFYLGIAVALISVVALGVRFSEEALAAERAAFAAAVAAREGVADGDAA